MDYWQSSVGIIENARSAALVAFEKDVTYRRWATEKGGIYVPVTAENQPNPHLAGIPERDIATASGKTLTLVNPAYMTRQVHELESRDSGVKSHITSLKPLRAENVADAWETAALKAFEQGKEEVVSVEPMDGVDYLRFMRPLYIEPGCLRCHRAPGDEVGKIRGGISVALPWARYRALQYGHLGLDLAGYGGIWIIGLLGLGYGRRRVRVYFDARNRAEAALRAGEERFRSLTEMSTDFFWETDAEHRLLSEEHAPSNATMAAGAGGRAAAQIGMRRWELPILAPGEQGWRAHRADLDAHRPFRSFQFSHPGPEGKAHHFAISGDPVFDAAGAFVGYRGVGTDITERKENEDKIRTLTRLYSALSQCNEAMLRSDSEDELFARICRVVVDSGYVKMAWVGVVLPQTRTLRFAACFGERAEEYLRGVEIGVDADSSHGQGPSGLAVRSGRPVWVDDMLSYPATAAWHARRASFGWRSAATLPLLKGGRAIGVFTLYAEQRDAFDPVARKLLLEIAANISYALDHFEQAVALRASEQKFAVAFRSSPMSITISRAADGRVLEANDSFLRASGHAREEVVGHTSREFGFWKNYEDRGRALEQLARDGNISGFRCEMRAKSGETLLCELWAEPIEIAGEACVLWVLSDITERAQVEKERAQLEHQFGQLQKIESVGRLAGGVAHDFNNMLAVIRGNVQLALEQTQPTHPLYVDLEEIRKAAERASALTQQLLAFARKQTIAPVALDLNATVSGILRMLQRLVGERIALEWRPGAELWPVKVDPSQVDQVLTNLCANARDAIANIGAIVIETANFSVDEDPAAANPDLLAGDYVRLTVSDNGGGMTSEELLHVFEPFYTTKAVGRGAGLGLATVYGIVQQNHGCIKVASAPGAGSTFTIYFPRNSSDEPRRAPEVAAAPGRGHETILLVEDEPALLALIARVLARSGYRVLAANTPAEAMSRARECAGELDLLVTDVVMPAINGRDLAHKVLALNPRIKPLFMSGYTADVIAHHGVLDPGVNFIQKPFSVEDFEAKVRAVLDAD